MRKLKYGTKEPNCKTDSYTWRSDLWLPRVRGEGRGMDCKFGVGRCKLLHLEWMNNKVLMYSTGNNTESPGINHNGKECIYVYN